MRSEPKYPIGTKFKTRGKHGRVCTIVDIYKTYNSKNDIWLTIHLLR